MSFCPTKDIHSVYLDNELPEHFKAEYELHLKNCPACQKELEKLKSLRAMLSADSEAITPDSHYMDQSFERLQIKMTYSKNATKAKKNTNINYKYIASATAAAAVFALIVPLRLKSSVAASNPGSVAIASNVNTVVPVTAARNSAVMANNVSFDSGRSVLVSGNIHDTVLSSESKRKEQIGFTKNVKEVEVFRPELEDEAISIRITVPGVGEIPVVTEINVPRTVISGRY